MWRWERRRRRKWQDGEEGRRRTRKTNTIAKYTHVRSTHLQRKPVFEFLAHKVLSSCLNQASTRPRVVLVLPLCTLRSRYVASRASSTGTARTGGMAARRSRGRCRTGSGMHGSNDRGCRGGNDRRSGSNGGICCGWCSRSRDLVCCGGFFLFLFLLGGL